MERIAVMKMTTIMKQEGFEVVVMRLLVLYFVLRVGASQVAVVS